MAPDLLGRARRAGGGSDAIASILLFHWPYWALAVAAPAVRAQESRDDKFRAWDTNRDGRLEMGEMQRNQANFRSMDCDATAI